MKTERLCRCAASTDDTVWKTATKDAYFTTPYLSALNFPLFPPFHLVSSLHFYCIYSCIEVFIPRRRDLLSLSCLTFTIYLDFLFYVLCIEWKHRVLQSVVIFHYCGLSSSFCLSPSICLYNIRISVFVWFKSPLAFSARLLHWPNQLLRKVRFLDLLCREHVFWLQAQTIVRS